MDGHEAAVATIAAEVRHFYDRQEPFRIYHGSTNSTRPSARQRNKTIDTSDLDHVLEVDVQAKTVLVEPNVPMDMLVKATLPRGFIPPVVMEFPGITVGGGFAGTAGESSSFRYGMFEKIVIWFEMVLANGEIIVASKSENKDLYYEAASSMGTLGIVTLLELELIEAQTYVELTYHRVLGVTEALEKIKRLVDDPAIDYLDGIMFSSQEGVVCSGRLTSTANAQVQRFSRATDPWFYHHAQTIFSASAPMQVLESIPLRDYVFRYDRGAFWTGRYAFKYFAVPFNRITRWILDGFMHARIMYNALHHSGHSKLYLLQDVAVPFSAAKELASYVDESLGTYPFWLCPINPTGQSPQPNFGLFKVRAAEKGRTENLLSFGVWGPGPRGRGCFVEYNRNLEHKVQALGDPGLYG
ncbi:Delta24-sterol reductase, partial [Lecanoromycetidae sp. Uapishka_2]